MTDHQHTGTICWVKGCNRARLEYRANGGWCQAYDTCSSHLQKGDIMLGFRLDCCQEENDD